MTTTTLPTIHSHPFSLTMTPPHTHTHAYNILSVFSLLLPTFDLKHHLHHPCNDCPNGWEFDDNIINDDDTPTTDIASNDFQPSIYFDDKPDREFNNETTSQFIFDLEAKMATDDATDATESIVFDNIPDRKFDNDD